MMPVSQKLAYEIAQVIFDEVGPEKGEKLLDKLVNKAIISRAPYSPKQSILYIRNQFNLILADWQKAGGN